MIITQEEVVNRQTVLHIELEAEDVDPYLDQGYRRVVQRTTIPGFRKGKAPRTIVERFIGRESLLDAVLDSMVPEVTDRAIAEQDLKAAGLPKVELLDTDPVTLKATVPLEPDVDLGTYRSLRVPEVPVEFSDDDVTAALDQIRQSMATWEPVDRPVQMGDTVTVKTVGKVGETTIVDEPGAVLFLDEHTTMPVPGFAENLVGLTREESKEFTVALPEDPQSQRPAGQEANFSVNVVEIKERLLPELDDEFARSYGDGHENLEALREKVGTDLRTEAEQRAEQQHKEAAIEALVEGSTIELSPLMVEHEVVHMEEERERVLQRINVRTDDYLKSVGKTADEMRSEMEQASVNRLSRSFALTKVAELEKVEVSDEEVEERVQSLLAESDQAPDEQTITDEMKGSIRRILLSEKTLDQLTTIVRGDGGPETHEEEPEPEEATQTEIEEHTETEEEGAADDREA